jgi:hypothetical protein
MLVKFYHHLHPFANNGNVHVEELVVKNTI